MKFSANEVGICVLQRDDLKSFLEDLIFNRFDGRELSALAAAQVLGISVSTLNRWIELNLITPSNKAETGARVERKFDLAYILTLDVKKIKSEYRFLNK